MGLSSRTAGDLVGVLRAVVQGRLEARVSGRAVAVLDADARELSVDLGALAGPSALGEVLRGPDLHLGSLRGVPGALARAGWTVRLREGDHEIVSLGRAVSGATGHVAVHPLAAWRAWRAERATTGSP